MLGTRRAGAPYPGVTVTVSQPLASPRPAALDEAAALPGAGLPSHGREACQAGDRLGVEATELRHLGQQARRGDARHALDRRQDLGPPGQPLVFGQPLPALGIDGGQMPVELKDH